MATTSPRQPSFGSALAILLQASRSPSSSGRARVPRLPIRQPKSRAASQRSSNQCWDRVLRVAQTMAHLVPNWNGTGPCVFDVQLPGSSPPPEEDTMGVSFGRDLDGGSLTPDARDEPSPATGAPSDVLRRRVAQPLATRSPAAPAPPARPPGGSSQPQDNVYHPRSYAGRR